MNPFFLLAVAVAISMLMIPVARRLAPSLGMVDQPDPRKVHVVAVPRIGGWGIVLGTIIPVVIVLRLDPMIQSFVIGGLILYGFGMWDDAKEASHWVKFCGQGLAAAAVVYYGGLWVSHFPFMGGEPLSPSIGKPFTVFAIVGMINAINHSDGLDGLAGGESILSLITIAFLSYMAGNQVAVAIAFATIGGILGFLRYNTHPAQIFMGDSGSQFLGFTLGFLAVYLTQVAHPVLSGALPLLFLGLPIIDILAVFVQRVYGGMHWFKASRNHIHHRLLYLEFHHYETVIIIYSVQALFVTCAVLMRYSSDLLVAATYVGVCTAVFALLLLAEKTGWRVRRGGGDSGLARFVERIKQGKAVRIGPAIVLVTLIPVYLVAGSLSVVSVPRDFGIVSTVMLVVLAFELLFGKTPDSVAIRAAIYVTAVFVAYLSIYFPMATDLPYGELEKAYFIGLAAVIGFSIRFSPDDRFGTTPTDYLIVFGVLALTVFGNAYILARETCLLVTYAIILLYGCEVVIGHMRGRWNVLSVATLATLAALSLRGWLLHWLSH